MQAMLHPDPQTFDWSALQGVYGFDASVEASPVPDAGLAAAALDGVDDPAVAAPAGPGFGELVDIGEDEDPDAPIDLARYLARVEEARPLLQPRIDDCFARADLAALALALGTLPADLPPLTGPLAVDAFTRWLELHEAHHEGVETAVREIRRLEPMFGA